MVDVPNSLVHEGGFAIAKDYLDRWYFKRPDGQAVPSCGYQLQDMMDDDIGDTIRKLSDPINNPSAEGLPAKTLFVAESNPPAYRIENNGPLH